jgi:hypothetical protein
MALTVFRARVDAALSGETDQTERSHCYLRLLKMEREITELPCRERRLEMQ